MCWGIFPFLVPCLSRGIIWADGEQPIRARHISNRSSWSIKGPSFLCSGSPPPQKLIIYLLRCIKALLQKDPSLSCVCVLAGEIQRHRDTWYQQIFSAFYVFLWPYISLMSNISLGIWQVYEWYLSMPQPEKYRLTMGKKANDRVP